MNPSDDFKKSIALEISMGKIKEDLKQFDNFKGTPTHFGKYINKRNWGYSCTFLINNKSRTYEDMDYEVNISNDEIFEYIINKLNEDIISAKSSSAYFGGYTI